MLDNVHLPWYQRNANLSYSAVLILSNPIPHPRQRLKRMISPFFHRVTYELAISIYGLISSLNSHFTKNNNDYCTLLGTNIHPLQKALFTWVDDFPNFPFGGICFLVFGGGYLKLGGGNSNISPRTLEKWSTWTCASFSDGLNPKPATIGKIPVHFAWGCKPL